MSSIDQFLSEGKEPVSLIRGFFPVSSLEDSRIDFETGNFNWRIDWKLNTDMNRPRKRSRIIFIVITQDLLDAYHSASLENKEEIKNKFKKYSEIKFKEFNPEHHKPIGESSPIETWYFNSLSF